MPGPLLSLAEQPIIHPGNVLSEQVRTDVIESVSVEMTISGLSALGEAQVHAQLMAGDGITPVPGYDYLFRYGHAVADLAAGEADTSNDLARATPLQAVKLGTFMAASAIEYMLVGQREYAGAAAWDEAYRVAQTVITNEATTYREPDREAALASAYALLRDASYRTAESNTVARTFIAETRAALTDADIAAHAAAFWRRKGEEKDQQVIQADVVDDLPYYAAPDTLVEDLDERFADASEFVERIMDGSHNGVTDVETSTPLDHYHRGALRAMAYVALATKEFIQQAAPANP